MACFEGSWTPIVRTASASAIDGSFIAIVRSWLQEWGGADDSGTARGRPVHPGQPGDRTRTVAARCPPPPPPRPAPATGAPPGRPPPRALALPPRGAAAPAGAPPLVHKTRNRARCGGGGRR